MRVNIIQVPYDSGRRGERQGSGPARFFEAGLVDALKSDVHDLSTHGVDTPSDYPTEISTAFELNRALSRRVRAAVKENRFPLVLSGNCNACIGTLGGLASPKPGVIWFDAHGEFNTPETTLSGFLDGMPLAMATCRCWQALLKTVPGFEPVPDECIVLVGGVDLGDRPAHLDLLEQR